MTEALLKCTGTGARLVRDLYCRKFQEDVEVLSKLAQLVETTIDLKAADSHNYVILAALNPDLQETKDAMKLAKKQIREVASQIAAKLGMELDKKLKLEHGSLYGHYLRISRAVFFGFEKTHVLGCEYGSRTQRIY